MNPYAAFPHLNAHLHAGGRPQPRNGLQADQLGELLSVAAYRWIGRAEALIERLAGRVRRD